MLAAPTTQGPAGQPVRAAALTGRDFTRRTNAWCWGEVQWNVPALWKPGLDFGAVHRRSRGYGRDEPMFRVGIMEDISVAERGIMGLDLVQRRMAIAQTERSFAKTSFLILDPERRPAR